MTKAYDPKLMQSAQSAARFSGHKPQQGVYVGLKGPSLETPAEVRFLQTIGADAVGFSTVLEVIAAVHAGMHVLGFSIITNVHDPDHPLPANVDQIISIAENTAPKLDSIIQKVIEDLPF
ncbi:MAG: purine-nucleoside phosphorylase, partial [Desulfobacterales bacterium]